MCSSMFGCQVLPVEAGPNYDGLPGDHSEQRWRGSPEDNTNITLRHAIYSKKSGVKYINIYTI